MSVAVVGAGASGLATAIFAARRGERVDLLDSAARPGAKILVSGGGRCNVTNVEVTARDFNGVTRIVERILAALPVDRTVAFFREIGVPLHEEQWGKLFPDTNRAATVLEALLGEARRLGVAFHFGSRVEDIKAVDGRFDLTTGAGRMTAGKVVVATGGKSLPKTGSDGHGYEILRRLGHSIVPTTPALAPLVLDGGVHAALTGVAVEAELTLHAEGRKPARANGPMLWTHFGVSGPAALDISRHWLRAKLEAIPTRLTVNLLPGQTFESVDAWLVEGARTRPSAEVSSILADRLTRRVADELVRFAGSDPGTRMGRLEREARRRIVHALAEMPLNVRDHRGWNYAEVTAGGVPLSEINPATMESRKVPGLHLVGEILDVDGRIGGFNFQWAWSTGWIAAQAL